MKRKANDLDLDSIEARKAAKIHHLNPGAVDKKDPCLNLIEVEKADNSHHLNVGEKDKNHPGLKTPTSTPTNEPGSKSIYDRLVASIALDYYNNKNESKFKLMEGTLFESTAFINFPVIGIVSAFFAMENSSIKNFLATLKYAYPRARAVPRPGGLSVRSCKVIEGEYEADDLKLIERDNEEEEDEEFESPINESEEPCREPHRIYEILCANIALDSYNNKNDLKFKLVEDDTLDGKPVIGSSGISIRCSFNAKEDSSIKQFFAELQYPPGLTVATCKVLEETSLENNEEDLKHDKDYAGEDRDSVDKQDRRFDEILEELRAFREEIRELKENQNAIMRLLKEGWDS